MKIIGMNTLTFLLVLALTTFSANGTTFRGSPASGDILAAPHFLETEAGAEQNPFPVPEGSIGPRGQECGSKEECDALNKQFYGDIKEKLSGKDGLPGLSGSAGTRGESGDTGLQGEKGDDGALPSQQYME